MTTRRKNRRQFLQASAMAAAGAAGLAGGAAGLAAGAWAAPAVAAPRPPNFLLLISDQLGLDAIAAHGCTDARTPNLDRLIGRGMTFLDSHCSNPVCSPARSSLFTGRMPVETGVIDNSRPIHASRPNLGQWLRDAGYETIYSGKWHLPNDAEMPGFHNLPTGGGQGVLADGYVSRACEAYLHGHGAEGGKPFLLVGSFLEPHDICFWALQHQYLVPPSLPFAELQGRLPPLPPNHRIRPAAPQRLARAGVMPFSAEQWQYYLYSYYRQVERVDANIGRVLDALDDTGQADNTVVIFTADHGEGRGRHLHVGKGVPHEEAVKVPLVMACGERISRGAVDRRHLVSGLDVMDTVCDLAGVRPPKTSGRSLRPLLEGRPVTWRELLGVEYQVGGRMLRSERFKYVRFESDPVEQLFDLQADPWETTNLYQDARHAGVLKDHRRMLADWEARLEPVEPTPEVVGPRAKQRGKTAVGGGKA